VYVVLSLEVSIHEGESQESLLRRFQKKVQISVVLRELKANRFFVPKSEVARIKAKKNAQRRRRQGY
jgi:ribosomal protein S21